MMNVTICSIHDLPKYIDSQAPDLVVSAVNGPMELPTSATHLKLPIEDVYNVMLRTYKEAIRDLLHAEGKEIVIHCYHGISRSAALACIKLYQEDPELVDLFLKENPKAEPNPLLLLFGDEELEADGDLLRRARWRYKGARL